MLQTTHDFTLKKYFKCKQKISKNKRKIYEFLHYRLTFRR